LRRIFVLITTLFCYFQINTYAQPIPKVSQPEPKVSGCRLVDSDLVGSFAKIPSGMVLVQFRDAGRKWLQWTVLPPDAQPFSSGTGKDIDTRFLGSSALATSSIICTAISVPYNNAFDLAGTGCPQHNTVVDSGPQVDVREIYFNGSKLRAIFRIIRQKWFAAGIYQLRERLALSVDGKILKTLPVIGYEPQVVAGEVSFAPGHHHVVIFGLLENGREEEGRLETPQGSICI
jgi:hypothetical protein